MIRLEHEEVLKQISKDPGFGKEDLPKFEDFLFPEGGRITDPVAVALHAERLAELKNSTDPAFTNADLAKICHCSVQAIGNIIGGKTKSVNLDYCNRLAQYFNCSAFYVLGVSKHKMGVLIDGKDWNIPFWKSTNDEQIIVLDAIRWAKLAEELFSVLGKVFHHPSSSKRRLLYQLINELF